MENSEIKCPRCSSLDISKSGTKNGKQQYQCKDCNRYFLEGVKNYKLPKEDIKISHTVEPTLGITLENFRSKNDPKTIIKEGLNKLTKDRLYKTSEFIQLIGLPTNFGSTRLMDMPGIEAYFGKCSSGTYWSHPDVVQQLKNEMVLR
jgi:hypothetical protein